MTFLLKNLSEKYVACIFSQCFLLKFRRSALGCRVYFLLPINNPVYRAEELQQGHACVAGIARMPGGTVPWAALLLGAGVATKMPGLSCPLPAVGPWGVSPEQSCLIPSALDTCLCRCALCSRALSKGSSIPLGLTLSPFPPGQFPPLPYPIKAGHRQLFDIQRQEKGVRDVIKWTGQFMLCISQCYDCLFCFLIYYFNTVFYKETCNRSLLSLRLCWLRFPVLGRLMWE